MLWLMSRLFFQSLVLLCICSAGALAQSIVPGQSDLAGPRRSGAAVQLPQIEPKPPPQPSIAAPAPAAPQGSPLSSAPIFVLRKIALEGNTALDEPSIGAAAAPYIGKPVSIADLEELRRQLTLLYINRGYINSGVTIPDQNVENSVVVYRAVEGRVTGIEVSGVKSFDPEYFRARLERGLTTPFNVADMEQEQQILLQDPLVRRLNIELLPGLVPGEARAHADVEEASPYAAVMQIANNQSPTVGEIRGQMQGSAANILGFGDILSAQYGRSQGINDGAIGYSLPILSDDTRLSLHYDINGTLVVAPTLSPLHITSNYDSLAVGLSRPFYRTAEQNLTLGLNLERRQAQTFIQPPGSPAIPFGFFNGADANGRANVTALRFYQDYLDRDAEHAFALRSTLSFGLPMLGATVTTMAPTGKFFSWLGQAQYVRRVYRDWDAVIRSDLQLSNHPLFPIEQFALGGIDTVRGYRQFLTVTDDAFFASAELRIPVGTLRLPYLADTAEAGTVQIVPFYDFGTGWNVDRATPPPSDISGVGAGVRWLIGSGVTAEVYYGKALRHVPVGTALEDRGLYFRLTAKVY
ncbi:MAG: ShlB/FhaC/HecB family hemolysin secretion/activation protein [Stellaceae bacterium]